MTHPVNDIPSLPPREPVSHKGTYGRALLIGGSRGMSGAMALCGKSALRGGAGLVKLAVPDSIVETVASFEPCYMLVPLPHDDQGRITAAARDPLRHYCAEADCVAVGPGMGRSDELNRFVGELYRTYEGTLLIDADGLNALAATEQRLAGPNGPRILTPHPGEFNRLVADTLDSRQEAIERAEQLAAAHDLVIVLKGNRTLVTDGTRSYFNTTGNPGMATGGTGDCLTGLVTALVCQGLDPFEAAVLGVYVHGRAGDLAANECGEAGLIASDLPRYLPQALQEVTGWSRRQE